MDPTAEAVFSLIRLITSPDLAAKKLAEIAAGEKRLMEAEQKFAEARAALIPREEELKREAAALDERRAKVAAEEARLRAFSSEVSAHARAIGDGDDRAKRRVLTLMGLDQDYGPLQDLPSWDELERRAGSADPHFGNSPVEMVSSPVEHAPAGSKLTREARR